MEEYHCHEVGKHLINYNIRNNTLGIKLHGLVLEVTGRSVLVAVGQSGEEQRISNKYFSRILYTELELIDIILT